MKYQKNKNTTIGSTILRILTFVPLIFLAILTYAQPHQDQPNIVLMYADDLGWTDLGIQGSGYYETPVIDQLARDGMRFTNAYAGAANCAPSRACLITGLNTPRHGIYTVSSSSRGRSENRKLVPVENTEVLDPSFTTLPQVLQENGYTTCVAGKWHISADPLPYGFDTNFGGNSWGHPRSYFSPYRNPQLLDGPEGEHLPDRLSREVSGWITENADKPFFVYFPFYSVHGPYEAPEDLKQQYQAKVPSGRHDNATYAAMIEAMDQAIGRVLKTIEELGLTKNTIIIFTSDNGPSGRVSEASPLRGTKGMFYEGGIREPFIVRWPGVVPAGAVHHGVISQLDIMPTLLEVVGASLSKDLDGQSILPLWHNEPQKKERTLYWHFPAYLQMSKKDKAFSDSHDAPHWRSTPCGVIRKGDWKLIEFFESDEVELYNLAEDIGEKNNLSTKNIKKTRELVGDLREWRQQVNAPVPEIRNPQYVQAK